MPLFTTCPELLEDEELEARPLEELLELEELLDDDELDELEDDELELLDEVRPELDELEELELVELLEPEAAPSGPVHALSNRQANKLVTRGFCMAQSQLK